MLVSSWVCRSNMSNAYVSSSYISPTHWSLFLSSLESFGLCLSFDGQTMFLNTFVAGSSQFSSGTPDNWSSTTTYSQRFAFDVSDGQFGVPNTTPNYGSWHQEVIDHTVNDTTGYMILYNPITSFPVIYTQKFRQQCISQQYEFSFYVANLFQQSYHMINPSFRLEVRSSINQTNLIASWNTVEIFAQNSFTWDHHDISFIASVSSVDIRLISQAPNGNGNDLVIDDIGFRSCSTNYFTICPWQWIRMTRIFFLTHFI